MRLEYELETKLEWFNKIRSNFTDKLNSLWSLAEIHCSVNNEIKKFANNIFHLWTIMTQQVISSILHYFLIYKQYSKIQVISHTLPNIALSSLLGIIKKEIVIVKTKLQTNEVKYNSNDVLIGYKLLNEAIVLLNNLEKYENKMQQYLIMSKMVPYILKLESTIDKFVSSTALLPKSPLISSDLNAFSFVSKLLTGELMGNETINPHYVLAENITKKPVFIIKSNKRKVDVPVLPTIKLFKSVT
ncbi:PREDICTED: uncharacterized protein LOC107073391 [Polistes dominula]|uniref:Uncharacterized protein LOC107073391 n=1 Tax=Polistes dominula TaxID=743375 RepID=A0ABM1JAL8_POLDO|nr:PREDICTED: uncharacterized protein LOC107073391 [Polistes dominula]